MRFEYEQISEEFSETTGNVFNTGGERRTISNYKLAVIQYAKVCPDGLCLNGVGGTPVLSDREKKWATNQTDSNFLSLNLPDIPKGLKKLKRRQFLSP